MRKKKKRNNFILALIVIVVSMSLGYAFLNTDLTINGTSKIPANSWNIYFDNIQITSGSVELSSGDSAPVINPSNLTNIDYIISLKEPGDFYEFTVDVINDGTIDAMIGTISNKMNGTEISSTNPLPSYLNYSITYEDNFSIEEKHLLAANSTETYKVRLEYRTDIDPSDLPNSGATLPLSYSVNYIQADESKKIRFKRGIYFTMVPDASTYSNDHSTITPNELTLWRVINKNNDGTIEAVSEYVSSNTLYFTKAKGYTELVQELQNAAAAYAKNGYTVATRMMGFDGQTLTIANDSSYNGTTGSALEIASTPNPLTGTGEEYFGGVGGDTLYLKDIQLVGNVYGSDTATYGNTGLKAYKVNNTSTAAEYWLASRYYYYGSSTYCHLGGRFINTSGVLSKADFRELSYSWDNGYKVAAVRPIITLSSNINLIGEECSKTNPCTLNNSNA